MALADVLTLYRSTLAAGAFAGALELSSDLRDDLDAIPAGALRYQIRATYAGESITPNVTRHAWQVEITVARKLGQGEAERAYTEGAVTGMVAQQQALGIKSFWKVAGVFGVDDERKIEPAERILKVVRWTVSATIILS